MTKVLVTGIGAISAIGNDVNENQESLKNARSGIRIASNFNSNYTSIFKFGEVDANNDQLKEILKLTGKKSFTRTDLLAMKAFEESVNDAKLNKAEITSTDTAFISGTTVGGMCLTDQLYKNAHLESEDKEYLRSFSYGSHTIRMALHYGIKGYTDTINTACSSSANSIALGCRLIKSGFAKRAIVGGVDSLAKYTVNGFNALQIMSEKPCQPFDQNRSGLTLGEGAAFLVLESEDIVGDKNIYAELSGYANVNDAHHVSSLSEDASGVVNVINGALKIAGITQCQIDYINAHGTGTENNDYVELKGFSKIFEKVPPYNATKSYTGHTLGAAGSLEAVFSVLSLINNELYPSLNVETPITEFNISPIKSYKNDVVINHVLTNSYGFSGNFTSLIISKI